MSMGGLIADKLKREGFALKNSLEAALPLQVWRTELEVERDRHVSIAEATVLNLVDAGVSGPMELALAMGLRSDTRLPERVLVRLLAACAVESFGPGFRLTSVGRAWEAAGSARERERVTVEVRLDPVQDALEWDDHERSVFANSETWTIELPRVSDSALRERKPDLAKLIRQEQLPCENERSPEEQRTDLELRAFSIADHSVHWRAVRLDIWQHPIQQAETIIGYVGEAENPGLTKLLAQHRLVADRKRVVLPD
jgi:hypothetical protein